ncbi:MAG: outer membrane lipoprotein-sorting protein [Henriciella sp.]|nr:outer membrane lipoprotein-sorting protein [Henriciella sp.]
MDEVKLSETGFVDSSANLTMILTGRNGQESVRELRIKTLEIADPDEGDKSMIIFDHPADVKGTILLTHSHLLKSDDQWLYLPALKRVKRISSANKSGPFMGSEFSYEDFSAQEPKKFEHTWIETAPCPIEQTLVCHVIERRPRYDRSGYSSQRVWVDESILQYRMIEYYDLKGSLLKRLSLSDFKLFDEQYWRAHDYTMENVQNGKKTRIIWKDVSLGNGFSDNDFKSSSLRRTR